MPSCASLITAVLSLLWGLVGLIALSSKCNNFQERLHTSLVNNSKSFQMQHRCFYHLPTGELLNFMSQRGDLVWESGTTQALT